MVGNGIEGMSGLYDVNWPGQGQNFPHGVETDFVEYWGDDHWGGALHDWWIRA